MAKIIALLFFALLHAQNAPSFGLTPRQPPIRAATLKQLAHIGIDLTFSAPLRPVVESKDPLQWEEGGMLFISEFSRREKTFQKWMELSQIRPSKLIRIDDADNLLDRP